MIDSVTYKIFSKGSTTYFYSSLFFPSKIKEDIFKLYSYVRTADDFVDEIPQDKNGFDKFKKETYKALKTGKSKNKIVQNYVDLHQKHKFETHWLDAFLQSMEEDFVKTNYEDMKETLNYIYGSAEVIGLFVAKILNLPKESFEEAKMLGRSMQYINMLRDIKEDNKLNRQYIPKKILNTYGLPNLKYETVKKNETAFKKLMTAEIKRYRLWKKQGEKGYKYIPKRLLIPIKTANDLYEWTSKQIENNPLIVFEKKVVPSKAVIGQNLVSNAWYLERKK